MLYEVITHLAVEILEHANIAGADLGLAIARELQEVYFAINRDLPDQVGKEDERPVQDADEHRNGMPVVSADCARKFPDLCADATLTDHHCEVIAVDPDSFRHSRRSWIGEIPDEVRVWCFR